LRGERGFALPLALGVIAVFGIVGASATYYSTQNLTAAAHSSANQTAYTLAEAGINNAMAVLSNPANNATNASLLPSSLASAYTSYYGDGYVKWWGTFDPRTTTWALSATGYKRNPAAAGGYTTRTIGVTSKVRASMMQPANNPAWNYIMALRTATAGGCDMSLDNGVDIGAPLYVAGNLCLNTPSSISGGPLVVKGSAKLDVNTNIGSSGTPINEAHVALGCSYKGGAWHSPCGPADHVFATVSDTVPTAITAPTVDLDFWYQNASPGPRSACTTQSGSPPVLDNDTLRNNSVPGIFNLTPAASDYSCIVRGGNSQVVGQLSWDHAQKVLTVFGTIFIDGSVTVGYGQQNVPIQYNGQATIYASGTVLFQNTKLCGGISGSSCDFASWNPNTEMLVFVASGSGGQVPAGDSIEVKNSYFQGGLWGGYAIELDTSSSVEGPEIASTEIIGNTVTAKPFPLITSIPAGAPGVPVVYAQPDAPGGYTG
jgi:hypothetical protein